LEGHKSDEHSIGKSIEPSPDNSQVEGHGLSIAIDTRATDDPRRHTEDSSIDAREASDKKIAEAKPPAGDTVAVHHSPTEEHRNPPPNDVTDARKARKKNKPHSVAGT